MYIEKRQSRHQTYFRMIDDGRLAYFPTPLSRHGYLVADERLEEQIAKALDRSELLFLPWLVAALAIAGITSFDQSIIWPALLFFVLLNLGLVVSEAIAVGPIRRHLPMVDDRRPLSARLAILHFGTRTAKVRTLLFSAICVVPLLVLLIAPYEGLPEALLIYLGVTALCAIGLVSIDR